MRKKKYRFIDLFSGCGGFSVGMEQAGHECLLGVDFDKHAIESFSQNHPHSHALCMDITKLTKKKLEEYIDISQVDMVIGGPPCQGFSTVGKGVVDDERNHLFKQFVRIVRMTKPKVVIFENVTGLLATKNEKTLRSIFKSFERLGYNMDARVMSAEEYGVPSKRRRAILMGVLDGEPRFPLTTHGERGKKKVSSVRSVIKKLKTKNGKLFNHDIETAQIKNKLDRDRLKHIPAGRGIRYERDEKEFLPKRLRYDVDWEKISEKRFRQTRLQRIPLSDPAPTILTSRSMYYHPTEERYLTVREAAVLQSFPNDFEFKGSLSAQFRQIGNAVPPQLSYAIGEELKKISFNLKKKPKLKSINFKDKAFSYRYQTAI